MPSINHTDSRKNPARAHAQSKESPANPRCYSGKGAADLDRWTEKKAVSVHGASMQGQKESSFPFRLQVARTRSCG